MTRRELRTQLYQLQPGEELAIEPLLLSELFGQGDLDLNAIKAATELAERYGCVLRCKRLDRGRAVFERPAPRGLASSSHRAG